MSTYKLILRAMEEELEKCKPQYIQDLPYDLRSTNWNEMKERYLACVNEMDKRENHISDLKATINGNLNQMDKDVESIKAREEYIQKRKEEGKWSKQQIKKYEDITKELRKDLKSRTKNVERWTKEAIRNEIELENLHIETEKVANRCEELRMI